MASFFAIYLLAGVVIWGGILVTGELVTDDEPPETLVRVGQVVMFLVFLPIWPVRLAAAIYWAVNEENEQ